MFNMDKRLLFARSIISRLMATPARHRFYSKIVAQEDDKNRIQQKTFVLEPLAERELIRVQGAEIVPFLQGLVSNDMKHLQESPSPNTGTNSMYAVFLNKAGRMLYDTIIYRTQDPQTYLIECDKSISNELRRHLRIHRVRKHIDINSTEDEFKLWIVFNKEFDKDVTFVTSDIENHLYYSQDPRYRNMGIRVITSSDINWKDLALLMESDNCVSVESSSDKCNYRRYRYQYGIGEGIGDLPPGRCFPLEANCDYLHGVSFQKGCYLGQELTARIHHTGFIRKRLMPLRLTNGNVESTATVHSSAGTNVGVLRGVSCDRALGLMRVEQALKAPQLLIDGKVCHTEKPTWWPTESLKKH